MVAGDGGMYVAYGSFGWLDVRSIVFCIDITMSLQAFKPVTVLVSVLALIHEAYRYQQKLISSTLAYLNPVNLRAYSLYQKLAVLFAMLMYIP